MTRVHDRLTITNSTANIEDSIDKIKHSWSVASRTNPDIALSPEEQQDLEEWEGQAYMLIKEDLVKGLGVFVDYEGEGDPRYCFPREPFERISTYFEDLLGKVGPSETHTFQEQLEAMEDVITRSDVIIDFWEAIIGESNPILKRGQASRDGGQNLSRNLERVRKTKLLWSLLVKFGQNFDSVWDELSTQERVQLSAEVNELETKEKHEYFHPRTLRKILDQNRQNFLASEGGHLEPHPDCIRKLPLIGRILARKLSSHPVRRHEDKAAKQHSLASISPRQCALYGFLSTV